MSLIYMIEKLEKDLCPLNRVGNKHKISKELWLVECIRQPKKKMKDQVKKRNKFQHLWWVTVF